MPNRLMTEEVDILFQRGEHETPNWISHPLVESGLMPVCSAKLIAPRTKLSSPRDLARYTILHSTARQNAWNVWCAQVKNVNLANAGSFEFTRSALAYQAAVGKGLGIAMADVAMVQSELTQGSLIQPMGPIVDTGCS